MAGAFIQAQSTTIIASAGGLGTLDLSNLISTHAPFSGDAQAGIQVNVNGNVYERVNGSTWTAQNPSTEWIDAFVSETSSAYEVQLDTASVFGTATLNGPSRGTYHQLNLTRTWTLDALSSSSQSGTFNSTLRIREIANPTTNFITASVFLSADATGV